MKIPTQYLLMKRIGQSKTTLTMHVVPSGFQICNISGNHGVVGLIINTIITMMKEVIKMKAQAAATGLRSSYELERGQGIFII